MKQAYLRDMFKEASRSVGTSTVVISLVPLTPASAYSVMNTPENRR
jgi:hypothetical protein